MLRASSVVPAGAWKDEPADTVVLDYDERYRRRIAMTGVRGLEFLLDLPEAVTLSHGDGLKLEDGRIVEVVAAPEPLAELRARDAFALARLAWHLGNRHAPTELTRKSLRIRRDPVLEDMARALGAEIVEIEAPFNPEGGAYVGGHAHEALRGHDHHDHHDHRHGDAHHRHGDHQHVGDDGRQDHDHRPDDHDDDEDHRRERDAENHHGHAHE